ncbi:MAG: hypothetical protein GWP19_00285 [Planctomycetia bacterium]|nr:hypothetical protein [Planctomycetia bacterium]
MEKKLDIIEIENKETKAGKSYSRIKTQNGWMACFDKIAIEELKKNIGKNCSVEVRESGEYSNIIAFHKVENNEIATKKINEMLKPQTPTRTMPKDPVGLAVEIFCGAMEMEPIKNATESKDIMENCIELVKQAQKAFS